MKTISLITFLLASINFCFAQTSFPYENLAPMLKIAEGSKIIDKQTFVPIYLKPKLDKLDYSKANFRISPKIGKAIKLNYQHLNEIPHDSLSKSDINYLKEGFIIKLWVPLNPEKHKTSLIKNDFKKGSLDIAFAKILYDNYTVEEARAKYLEDINKEDIK